MTDNNNRIAITLGDPSGIGPEVIIKAINDLFPDKKNLPIIISYLYFGIELFLKIHLYHHLARYQDLYFLNCFLGL